MTTFWVKIFYYSLKFGPNLFLQQFKNKIISNFVKFVATKKGMTTSFFSPLSFVVVLDLGSEIRDPGWKKSGSGIRDKHPGSATLLTMKHQSSVADMDPLVQGTDPDPSIIKQKLVRKNLIPTVL